MTLGDKRKVLVVDDDASVIAIVFRWLVDDGFDVVACHSVEAARRCFDAWLPDVLITDVRVDGTNGFFLAVIGSQRTPPVRTIVMSGFADPVLQLEAKKLNAPFLSKPLNRAQVLQAVHGHQFGEP
jgi:DNA-binding NtrC family response regulator